MTNAPCAQTMPGFETGVCLAVQQVTNWKQFCILNLPVQHFLFILSTGKLSPWEKILHNFRAVLWSRKINCLLEPELNYELWLRLLSI
jgi:hypothetical protein